MRLVLFDRLGAERIGFHPLALSRPVFELRCGITSLGEKLVERTGARDVACFVPPYLAETYRARTAWPVNDPACLQGDDLWLVNGRVKAEELDPGWIGPSQVACDPVGGDVLWAHVARDDLVRRPSCDSLDALLDWAKTSLPPAPKTPGAWKYLWELVLANPAQLTADFLAAGRFGIEGTVEEPFALRGGKKDLYIAPGASVHPMVVIDAEHGPVYLDENVVVHPFTRIEGPCYVGPGSMLLGAKCREGNSIGPMCRVGGEVEESILLSHSNKYHDGFLGHAYVGQWVNLGAQTTNSDLKNDYSNVTVVLDGKKSINTGTTKVGSLIGDHAKASIGTLLTTGAYIGAMTLITTHGGFQPKFIPSFASSIEGKLSECFCKEKLYDAAGRAMRRRGQTWTAAAETLWNAVYEQTVGEREEAFRRSQG
ncbi:MAG: putative sugar nucleotidyl transferase [Thermoguttaceae bacterium]